MFRLAALQPIVNLVASLEQFGLVTNLAVVSNWLEAKRCRRIFFICSFECRSISQIFFFLFLFSFEISIHLLNIRTFADSR